MTKSISKRHSVIYRYVRIYLDDIMSIIDIMKGNCDKIIAYGDGYELENPSEIDEYQNLTKEQFYSLTIRAINPDVSVQVSPGLFSGVGISVIQDDVKSIGIFKKIEDIIKKRRRKFVEFINSFIFFALILFSFSLIMAYLKTESIVRLEITLIIFFCFILMQAFQIQGRKVVFINKYIKEEKNFIIRNKDQIALVVLGAILTLVMQWLVKKL